jgi:hypothetical protein
VALGAALYAYSLVADDLQEDAVVAASESYEVALRSSEVVRKLVDEVQRYQGGQGAAASALDERLEGLLKTVEESEPEPDAAFLIERGRHADALDPDLPRTSDRDLPGTTDRDLPQAVAELRDGLMELDWKAAEVIERLAAQNANDPRAMEIIEQARAALERQLDQARNAASDAMDFVEEARAHGNARRVDLRDVTSLPLGIAATGDLFTLLIAANTAIPARHQRVFTTSQDGQTEVEIRVFQGREQRCRDNQLLGSFILQGIAPAARMTQRIDVAFRIDESGILSVQARDADSGAAQGMRVEDPLGLQKVEPGPEAEASGPPPGAAQEPDTDPETFDFSGMRDLTSDEPG